MVGVEEHVSNGSDGIACARATTGGDRVHADEDTVTPRVHCPEPLLKTVTLDPGQCSHALSDTARVVGLQKDRDPVIRLEGDPQEPDWCGRIDSSHQQRSPAGRVRNTPPVSMNARTSQNLSQLTEGLQTTRYGATAPGRNPSGRAVRLRRICARGISFTGEATLGRVARCRWPRR